MIYTKKGDTGETDLANGKRVPKTDTTIEALGALDELNAHLGLLLAELPYNWDNEIRGELFVVQTAQRKLFQIGAKVAGADVAVGLPSAVDVCKLEAAIDNIERQLGAVFNGFVLPGGCLPAAQCHVARTVCRRTEILLLRAGAKDWEDTDYNLPYINRLSDFLYAFARKINHLAGIIEL